MGYPAYTTSIVAQEPDTEAMATAVESYSASEIDPIEFSTLSAAEQTAITRASQSPQLTYTDRGASDSGTQFKYRNDIVNFYFVSYNDSIIRVRVVIAMDSVSVGAGSLSGLVGAVLAIGGVWGRRRSES
jgi:hypothetical protein